MCIMDWCLQSGTEQQYTKCKRVSEDGRTCYNPTIKFGSTIGGIPFKHWANNYNQWCQQLFPTSNSGSVTFSQIMPQGFFGAVYWCNNLRNIPKYWHWCDWV